MAGISLLFCCLFISSVWSLKCIDPNGNPVDWYSSYKAPRLHDQSSLFKDGLAHYYMDVNSQKWTLSKFAINANNNTSIHNTLKQVYSSSQNKSLLYIMYNDEHPKGAKNFGGANSEGANSGGGHTKGVVAFDDQSGFWLIHSVPKFPPAQSDGFSYPETGEKYGQSFLCITLSYKMLGLVAKQLLYNEPHIYDSQVPSAMKDDFPVLGNLMDGDRPQGPPWFNVVNLKSLRGQNFTSFAKSTKYNKDLYTDLVAPVIQDGILVESWMDGSGGKLATNCSVKYKVYNVVRVNLPGNVLFKRTKDHSKWATGFTAGQNSGFWTCVGDINRMHSQFNRGGGTMCLNNQNVWKAFRQSVDEYEKCNSTRNAQRDFQ